LGEKNEVNAAWQANETRGRDQRAPAGNRNFLTSIDLSHARQKALAPLRMALTSWKAFEFFTKEQVPVAADADGRYVFDVCGPSQHHGSH
jgi:hypothetical protein